LLGESGARNDLLWNVVLALEGPGGGDELAFEDWDNLVGADSESVAVPLEGDGVSLYFVSIMPVLSVDIIHSVLFSCVVELAWLLDCSIPGEN
jgi:hypothetical protein